MTEAPIHTDLGSAELIEFSLKRGEGHLSNTGALVATTGARTGRSPADRFIVDEPSSSNDIEWGTVNRPISADIFSALWGKVSDYLCTKERFVSHSLNCPLVIAETTALVTGIGNLLPVPAVPPPPPVQPVLTR